MSDETPTLSGLAGRISDIERRIDRIGFEMKTVAKTEKDVEELTEAMFGDMDRIGLAERQRTNGRLIKVCIAVSGISGLLNGLAVGGLTLSDIVSLFT